MQLRTFLMIGLALVFGVSAAAGVNLFLQARTLGAAAPSDTVEVVVASADINRWATVHSDLVTTRQVPKDMVPKGALRKVADATNRVTLVKCSQNEILLDSQLAKKGRGPGIASGTPDGMRAFTIKTTKLSGAVSGFILPGHRVDVLLTVTPPQDTQKGTVTLTLLTNIEVLAVDQVTDVPTDSKAKTADLKTVTLLVTPTQAAKLALGDNKGSLHLSLRNNNDSVDVPPTKITLADIGLVEERPKVKEEKPAPAPPPAPVKVVQPPPEPLRIRTIRNNVEGRVVVDRASSSVLSSD